MAKKNTPIEYVKTQSSWFKTDDDIKFENSFKFWFALQWQNHFIHIFALFITLLILEIFNFNTVYGWVLEAYYDSIGTGIFVTPFIFLPLIGTIAVVYKGFWQFFNDLKNGNTR